MTQKMGRRALSGNPERAVIAGSASSRHNRPMRDAIAETFFRQGWVTFPKDEALGAWVAKARPLAEQLATDQENQAAWLRCGGTWFAGVNIFPNDASGAVVLDGIPPLAGTAVDFARRALVSGDLSWDNAQISVCYPGYPQPWDGESDAAYRFRRHRDAAHVDGILPTGPQRRRHLGEHHAFVLGIPLSVTPPEASPLVVWTGSHNVMRQAFRARFRGIPPEDWSAEDITEVYQATRRYVFQTCERVPIHAAPGEAYLIHRLALHGVAPWTAPAGPSRTIAYFRPEFSRQAAAGAWLDAD